MMVGRSAEPDGRRHPLAARYLDQIEAELKAAGTPPEEVVAILADLEAHFADARAAGRSLSSTLESLGPVNELAGAYGVALALGVRVDAGGGERGRGMRSLLLGALEVGRLIALALLALLLGVAGVALVLAGTVGAPAALILPLVPPTVLDPTLRVGLPQLVVLALSLLSAAVGWLSLRLAALMPRLLRVGIRTLPGPRRSRVRLSFQGELDYAAGACSGLANVSRPKIESWRR
jgi:uncharacterized membrane protein